MKSRLSTALTTFFSLLAGPALALCQGDDSFAALSRTAPADQAAILEAAHAVPYAQGRFWKVEKDGVTSWVFGTFHSAEPRVTDLPAPVRAAFDASDRLIVEITGQEMEAMQQDFAADPSQILDLSGTLLSDRISPEALVKLEEILPGYGLNLDTAERMQPWFLTMILAQPACAIEEQQANPVLDHKLMALAAESGKPVEGLETGRDAIAALRPEDPALQAALLEVTLLSADDSENYYESSIDLYLSGESRTIWEYGKYETYRNAPEEKADMLISVFEDRMIDGRNLAWMPAIEAALSSAPGFVAVGALHLPGQTGILNQLAEAGWSVTRVPL